VVDEYPFAAGGAQLGLLCFGVLLAPGDAGLSDFVCHAENATADVSGRLGFGRGFRRATYRRVAQMIAIGDETVVIDRLRQAHEFSSDSHR